VAERCKITEQQIPPNSTQDFYKSNFFLYCYSKFCYATFTAKTNSIQFQRVMAKKAENIVAKKSLRSNTKKALVVGINAYDPPNALPSCLNDADGFMQLLKDSYGFESVSSLRDTEASKQAILDGLQILLEGAIPGDDLVFYFSGHGYTFQQGNELIEALVPQDADFLTSEDMSTATRGVPLASLTVVLDSCFSGGMQKGFAKAGGIKQAKVKFWTPPHGEVAKAFALDQPPIQTYKAFGANPTPIEMTALVGQPSAVAKEFSTVSPPTQNSNRQFILLSACQADETAAASTDLTEGQSAFTFSLLQQIATNGSEIGVANLLDETGKELRQLGIRQTPMLKVPAAPPELPAHAFLLWEEPIPEVKDKSISTANKLPTVSNSTAKGYTMAEANLSKDWLSDIESIVREVTPMIAGALKDYRPPVKGFEPQLPASLDKGLFDDLTRTVATIVPALIQGMKQFEPPAKGFSSGKPEPFDKGWFDSITSIVANVLPEVISALKDYKNPNGSLSELSSAAQKGWFDDITHVVASVLPVIISATKDLKVSGSSSSKGFEIPAGEEKGFWHTLGSIARVAVPIALTIL
jgi:Caspase domain